jgi:hypothetical protein
MELENNDASNPKPSRPKITVSISKRLLYWIIGCIGVVLIVVGIILADSAIHKAYNDGYNLGYSKGKTDEYYTEAELNAYVNYFKEVKSYEDYVIIRVKATKAIYNMFPDIQDGEIPKYLELFTNNKISKYPVEYFTSLGYTYTGD